MTELGNYFVLAIIIMCTRGTSGEGRDSSVVSAASHFPLPPLTSHGKEESNANSGFDRTWQWNAEVHHDPAGGVYRVSGDGPKANTADPVLDVGSPALLTENQIQSHPNFKYLPGLKDCGLVTLTKTMTYSKRDSPTVVVDLEDYDLVGVKDDKGKNSASEEVVRQRRKRIVGGKAVWVNRHPWMVQLYLVHISTGEHLFHCAGTIISNSTILTAAHCITRTHPSSTLGIVVVGMGDRRKVKFCRSADPSENCTREVIHAIEGSAVNQNYSEGNLKNDIGLIYLKSPLQFFNKVRPVCLPYSGKLMEGWPSLKMKAVGWGSTNKYVEGFSSSLLKEVEIDLQPRSVCDMFHIRVYGRTTEDRMCTGGHTDKATCNGDSGGGIMKSLKIQSGSPEDSGDDNTTLERVFQFGIVSAGGHVTDTCGFQGRPAIDTNVIFYMEWILNHIVPGVQAYELVKQDDVDSTSTPSSSPFPLALWEKIKSKTLNESDVDQRYKNEFSTGDDVDVSQHRNVHLLPSLETCGSIMMKSSSYHPTSMTEIPIPIRSSAPAEPSSDIHHGHSQTPTPIRVSISVSGEEELKRRKRIVGGVPTGLENYLPWMAQVYVRNVEINNQLIIRCSGTIISPSHILTAAHCVTEIAAPFVFDSIIVGQYNRNSSKECFDGVCYHPQKVKIAEIVIHPEFEKYTQRNNIAIVKLSEPLQFNTMIQPICLPRRETLMNGIRLHKYFTAGWGRVTREAGGTIPNTSLERPSEILLQTSVRLRPRNDCDFVYSRSIYLLERSRLCGGGQAAMGECIGDGGSPLMKRLETEGSPSSPAKVLVFQLGLVVFTDCGMEGMPTVYLNIISYMDWILDNLRSPDDET